MTLRWLFVLFTFPSAMVTASSFVALATVNIFCGVAVLFQPLILLEMSAVIFLLLLLTHTNALRASELRPQTPWFLSFLVVYKFQVFRR